MLALEKTQKNLLQSQFNKVIAEDALEYKILLQCSKLPVNLLEKVLLSNTKFLSHGKRKNCIILS